MGADQVRRQLETRPDCEGARSAGSGHLRLHARPHERVSQAERRSWPHCRNGGQSAHRRIRNAHRSDQAAQCGGPFARRDREDAGSQLPGRVQCDERAEGGRSC